MLKKAVKSYVFKVVLLGDYRVGKTSLIQRFIHNKFSYDYKVTLGVNVLTKVVKFDDIQCTLSIFDLAGQERFREIQKVFYVGTNAVIYVFDFTRPDTLKNLDKWQNALYRGIEDEKEVISILIGNKVDLKDQLLVNRQDAEEKALALNCRRFLQTSALTGEHVDEAFSYISETLIHKANQLLARIR